MAVTIRDIAKKVGVSPSTVSRALNNKGRISEVTRKRILETAHALNYAPNMNAKGLATQKTGNIGVILNRKHNPLLNPFYGRVILGVEEGLQREGYHLIFATIGDEPTLPACVRERRVDGLIVMGCDVRAELIASLREHQVPLVLVDNCLEGVDAIATDNVGGAYAAVQHLIALGHRKIGFVAERLSNLSFRERFEGYRLALQDHSLTYEEDLVTEGLVGPDYGYVATRRLLKQGRAFTALFAANDSAAIGAIKALQEAGLWVPQDVAVVGFDDGELAPYATPPLTTVRVPREEMGRAAARRLLELLRCLEPELEAQSSPVQLRLPTQLIIRESCGQASKL